MDIIEVQRLADRTVQRYARSTEPLSKVDVNHLRAFIGQIESAHTYYMNECDKGNADIKDELYLVQSQLTVLKGILKRQPTLKNISFKEESSEDEETLLIPRKSPTPVQESSNFAQELKHRKPHVSGSETPQLAKEQPKQEEALYRSEHDEIAADMYSNSLHLKANSERLQALLKEDTTVMAGAERLLDVNEGEFKGQSQKLSEQVKADSWGFLKIIGVLIVGILLFLFMYLYIKMT